MTGFLITNLDKTSYTFRSIQKLPKAQFSEDFDKKNEGFRALREIIKKLSKANPNPTYLDSKLNLDRLVKGRLQKKSHKLGLFAQPKVGRYPEGV